ncbi:hypothetical protein CCH79_00020088, partial [Gambusia affinis]
RQFGLDGRGGYRRQMERSMERAVASGHLTPLLLLAEVGGVQEDLERLQGQKFLTFCPWSLIPVLFTLHCPSPSEKTIPSIPRVQRMIEEAWKEGLDPQGASHFSKRLQRTQAWIGATEIYVLLTSLGISARIIDFHQPTGCKNTHPHLFDWIKQYFCQSSESSSLSPRLILTHLPPLYLQHQGHSRTVVGLEQRKNGSLCLLLLDPGSSSSDTRKLLSRETRLTAVQFVRKFPRNLKHKQYQLIAVQGVLSPEEKQSSSLSMSNGSKFGSSSSKSKSSMSWNRDSSTSTLFPAEKKKQGRFRRR